MYQNTQRLAKVYCFASDDSTTVSDRIIHNEIYSGFQALLHLNTINSMKSSLEGEAGSSLGAGLGFDPEIVLEIIRNFNSQATPTEISQITLEDVVNLLIFLKDGSLEELDEAPENCSNFLRLYNQTANRIIDGDTLSAPAGVGVGAGAGAGREPEPEPEPEQLQMNHY